MADLKSARETVLPNGLRIVTLEVPEADKFIMDVMIKVGSMDDGSHPGVSHFLEHMKFAGTPTRSKDTLTSMFQKMGGHFGAATGFDRTSYHYEVVADAEKKSLATMVETAADVQFNGLFPSDRLEHEREVILNEMGFRRDLSVTNRLVHSVITKNTSYAIDPGGRFEYVRKATAKDLQNHIDTQYCAKLATIYISGPASHDDLAGTITENFSGWKQTGYQPSPVKFQVNPFDIRIVDSTRIQNHIALWFFQENYYPTIYPIDRLAGKQVDTALYKFRQRASKAYGIERGWNVYDHNAYNMLITNSRPETSSEYTLEVARVIARLHTQLDPDTHAHAINGQLRTLKFEGLNGQPELHGKMVELHSRNGGRLYDQATARKEFERITFEDVRTYAAAMYRQPTGLIVIGPDPQAVPSLEEISKYFAKQPKNPQRVFIRHSAIKPDIA